MALTNIVIRAVEYRLVAPDRLADCDQSVDDPQSQFLPLHILAHSNVLNMADSTQTTEELAFDKHCSSRDDFICRLFYN